MQKLTMPSDDPHELFIVVDENDNILEYRSRKECHEDSSLIHRAVDVLITNEQGHILVQKRSMTKDLYPGAYTCSASGHVTKGQTYLEAAYRELKEELGINVTLQYVGKTILYKSIETEIFEIYTGTHNGPFDIDKKEVDEVIFVDPSDLKTYQSQFTPGFEKVLQYMNYL